MRFLIVGLGNPGVEYADTRHNVGFKVLEKLASKHDVDFSADRYAERCEFKSKGRAYVLIRPMTYMNLSGKAVRYWLQAENLDPDRLLVVTDDLALPFGRIRMRGSGGSGGHNGLQNIVDVIGNGNWSRLRVGIGKDFHRGEQVNYVLGEWGSEEIDKLDEILERTCNSILSYGHIGLERTMNSFNN